MRTDWTTPEGFTELVREHQAAVFRTLSRLTGSGPHVEDLAQDAFLRLYRALPEFRGDAQISTYLYRIVVNLAQDEWKRRRRDRERFAAEPAARPDEDDAGEWLENLPGDGLAGEHARTPLERLEEAQLARVVDAALAELPENERAVLVLYHGEDCSYEGVAAALNMPLNTVRTHLHRGRKRLSELVRERQNGMPGEGGATPRAVANPTGQAKGSVAGLQALPGSGGRVRG